MSNLLTSDPDNELDELIGSSKDANYEQKAHSSTVYGNGSTPSNEKELEGIATTKRLEKVAVRLQPIGSTPLLKPQILQVSRSQNIGSITKFLMRRLRLTTAHVYVLSSFQPTPDECIGTLHDLFKTNEELILSYCEQIAYG